MRLYLVLFLLFCSNSYSQLLEYDNFLFEDGELIWQKVYETNSSKKEVINVFRTAEFIKDLDVFEDKLVGFIENLFINLNGYSKRGMLIPWYIETSYFSSFLLVELKEGRYRITLKDMKLMKKYGVDTPANFSPVEVGEYIDLKVYATDRVKKDFRRKFKKAASGILNFIFDKNFQIKQNSDSDW